MLRQETDIFQENFNFQTFSSGSTGKPKGVLHTTAGYLLYTATTFKYSFDYQEDDVYWCTADVGWITGHSYITYGPMANGATGVIVSIHVYERSTYALYCS